MTAIIQTRKNIMVGRLPNLSCAQPTTARPIICPQSDEFESPDCHLAEMDLSAPSPTSPKRCLNWVCP